jgi:hypothetical protein
VSTASRPVTTISLVMSRGLPGLLGGTLMAVAPGNIIGWLVWFGWFGYYSRLVWLVGVGLEVSTAEVGKEALGLFGEES